MENYDKGEVKVLDEDKFSFDVTADVIQMNVNYGSKIKNLMGFAMKNIKDPNVKQLVWKGSGSAVSKVISCTEIMKRKVPNLHQITDITYKRIEEYWEPKIPDLERLKVNRDIPAVAILLSKDVLDTSHPGYQAPGIPDVFWSASVKDKGPSSLVHRGSKGPNKWSSNPASSSKKRRRRNSRGAKPDTAGISQEKESGASAQNVTEK